MVTETNLLSEHAPLTAGGRSFSLWTEFEKTQLLFVSPGSMSFILLQSDWSAVIGQLYTPPVRLAGTLGSAFSLGAPTNTLLEQHR